MTVLAVARMHGATTRFVDGRLASISTARLVAFVAVQFVRLAIAATLCYGGSYFIAHTIGLGDLILNCVALQVRRLCSLAHALASACGRAWMRFTLLRAVSSSWRLTSSCSRPSPRES